MLAAFQANDPATPLLLKHLLSQIERHGPAQPGTFWACDGQSIPC